jgi:transcriptional activator SPT7
MIEDKQLWAGYLTEQEHTIWRKALLRRETFAAFLQGRGEPVENGDGLENSESVNSAPKADDNGEKVTDAVTTAFRARVMLFEASVRKLFPSRTGEDFDFDVDDIPDHTEDMVAAIEKPKTREVEEDNYDDDDEEEESTDLIPVPESSNQDADSSMDNIGSSHETYADVRRFSSSPPNNLISLPHILPHLRTRQSSNARTANRRGIQTLCVIDSKELNRQNSTEATANGTQNSLSNVNFGAANLSLKHLLSKIDSKRDALALTDAELRKLLSDVRKNRSNSKWASDELIGREELYEALESMLKKIMADKNAYPFLAKVRRMQAPDYYNIIHRPMDLGTMHRNLKTGTYFRSKAHFLEELNLIWDNCLIYNTDPVISLSEMVG